MDEFPSNSHKVKTGRAAPVNPEPKKVEKVIEGEVIRRKKPLGKRFAETFIQGDTQSVWSYVLWDVLTPALKDTFADMVTQGVERSLFGETRSASRRGHRASGPGYVPYNRVPTHTPPWRQEPRAITRRDRAAHNFDDIILATRVEAEEVIDKLYELVTRYEVATVSDLYELIGATVEYTDDKWGWVDLRGAGVTRSRNGYLLNLPRPEPID